MKQSLLNRWILALESGTIPQTKNQLGRRDGSRCCLGVLCDLIPEVKTEIVLERDYDNDEDIETDSLKYGYAGVWDKEALPEALWKELSFHNEIGAPTEEHEMRGDRKKSDALANLNDTGTSFSDIALRLRNEPGRYFTQIDPDEPPLPPR